MSLMVHFSRFFLNVNRFFIGFPLVFWLLFKRPIIQSTISGVADVYSLLRESFKDILQEFMEAELDACLGHEKNHKGESAADNKRNDHSPKTLKSQYDEFQENVPKDCKISSTASGSPLVARTIVS